MFNFDDFVKVMKQAGTEAVTASKPANVVFGKVISADPLKIQVEQKLILSKAQLILTRNVTDYEIDMTVNGVRNFQKVHNHLNAGEEVMLMQVPGGQVYIVIDRIGKG